MAEHTPGPWDFEPDREAPALGFAWVFHAGTRQHVASRVRPGDAALIAAAPDTLAALERALHALEWCHQWLSGEDAQAIALDIQGARAAIARARDG
jgi:hypothetical protein